MFIDSLFSPPFHLSVWRIIHSFLLLIILFIEWRCEFLKFLLLFNYSCVPFLPIPPPHPSWTPLPPHLHPPPWFCPCVLYSSSCNPLFSLSPPHSPVAMSLTFLSLYFFFWRSRLPFSLNLKYLTFLWKKTFIRYLWHLSCQAACCCCTNKETASLMC